MTEGSPLIALRGVEKDYRTLRPLRIRELDLYPAEAVALLGLDQPAAEVLVNLIAGATVPDKGEVMIGGRPTTAITDGESWMQALDDFGIITERAVLLDQMTAEQNLAVPLTLELHDLRPDIRASVSALAAEVDLPAQRLAQFTSTLTPLDRMRVRLARALAGRPRIMLAEHPNAMLEAADLPPFGALLRRIVAGRGVALLVLTADKRFASAVANKVLELNAATGELSPVHSGWRAWFR